MLFQHIVQDAVYGFRQLRRDPVFALVTVLTIAIGIGANTAVFTMANALLFRNPVGVAEPHRLIDIGVRFRGFGFASTSYPNYRDISQRATTLQGVYAHPRFPAAMNLGNEQEAFVTRASTNYFAVLGVVPTAGRLFVASDTGDSRIAVLNYGFWTRRFNKDPAVVGQTLRFNGEPFTVVGVASPGFHGTGVRGVDAWIPLQEDGRRAGSVLLLGARLKPGVSMAQVSAELDQISRSLEFEHPAENRDRTFVAAGLSPIPGETGPVTVFLALLLTIVSLVLAIACANVSSLLLARAAARRSEIAVRLAIGAGRGRIVRQLLTETLALFLISAAAGVVLARALTSALVSRLPSLPFPIDISLSLDGRAVAFSMGLSLLAAVITGLVPSLQAARSDVVTALKSSAQGAFGRFWLRHAFVITQVALSTLLVIVGGLFLRTLQNVALSDPGFDARNVELVSLDLAGAGYTNLTGPFFSRQLIDRVRGMPNVESATLAVVIPGGFEGIGLGGLAVDGVAPPDGEPFFSPVWNVVESDYFATLRMPLLAGRDFNDDDRDGTQPVVILGEGAARRFWPGQDPIGRHVQLMRFEQMPVLEATLQVVGVVRDPKFGSLVDGTTGVFAYLPIRQRYVARTMIVARSANGARISAEIRSAVQSLAPGLNTGNPQKAEDYVSLGLVPQRIAASVAGSLGIVGMLLAGIGIYGVTASMVVRRRREMGIRTALGAQRAHILRMVLQQGLSLVVIGTGVGVALAALASGVLSLFLLGSGALDPIVYWGTSGLFVGIGLLASYLPARRATRVNAIEALREY